VETERPERDRLKLKNHLTQRISQLKRKPGKWRDNAFSHNFHGHAVSYATQTG
jgi:hypothetical protein